MEQFLERGTFHGDLGLDDRVAIKRLATKFVMQHGELCRKLPYAVVPMVQTNEHVEILRKVHLAYTHCGAQKLLQLVLRSVWWPGVLVDCHHVRACVVC